MRSCAKKTLVGISGGQLVLLGLQTENCFHHRFLTTTQSEHLGLRTMGGKKVLHGHSGQVL